MNRILLLAILLAFLAACRKSGGTVNPVNAAGLSGKYTAYKLTDTTFFNGVRADGVQEIDVYTLQTDTAYTGIGTAHPHAAPGSLQNFSPDMVVDTLVFKSPTTGVISDQGQGGNFTYNLKAGTMDLGDPTTTVLLTQIDEQTIKMVSFQASGGYTSDVSARYFKKQ